MEGTCHVHQTRTVPASNPRVTSPKPAQSGEPSKASGQIQHQQEHRTGMAATRIPTCLWAQRKDKLYVTLDIQVSAEAAGRTGACAEAWTDLEIACLHRGQLRPCFTHPPEGWSRLDHRVVSQFRATTCYVRGFLCRTSRTRSLSSTIRTVMAS
jgi:hypothetical protein